MGRINFKSPRGSANRLELMDNLLKFIKSQKLMVIASHGEKYIWVANVYYGIDDNFKFYFVSPEDTKHSQQILKNPKIAFSVVWFDPANHKNRKAVQGLGSCRLAQNEEEMAKGVQLHNYNFPEFAQRITVEWIHANEFESRIWVVEPSYMKYWDDELYGEKETEEFSFES